jgi:hypothetical protein
MVKPVKYTVGTTKREVYKPAQQSCPPQEALPRYYYVQPLQNTPQAWNGASSYVDFEVPAQTGVMTEATLRFQLTSITSNHYLPSTPFWIDHIEVYIGSDLVETVWKHEIWNEEIAWRSTQELSNVSTSSSSNYSIYNARTDGLFHTGNPLTSQASPSSNGYWFLNMPTCMRSAKPYVRGFQSRIKFRVYFPTTINTNSASASTYPTLNECIMIVEEASTDPVTIAELERAHKQSTVDYTVITRNRVQQQYSSGQLSSNTDAQIYLRGFKNKSAGVVVYATTTNAFAQNTLSSNLTNTRYFSPIYQLLDAQNNKITERLPVEWLEDYIFHDAVGSCSTQQFDVAVQSEVIFPFSADFGATITKGCSYGGFRFTTLEQLVLGGTASTNTYCVQYASSLGSNMVITATSYDYGHITVSGGRHSFRME